MDGLINFKKILDEYFEKQPKHLWHSFQKKFKDSKKWCLASDDCFDNQNKFNDCIAFTLFPYADLTLISNGISKIIPKDMKKTNKLSKEVLDYLKEHQFFFHIVFIIKNKEKIIEDREKKLNKKEVIIKILENSYKLCSKRYPEYAVKLKELLQRANKNNFSNKMYVNIFWTAFLAAYVNVFIIKNTKKTDGTLWIPDRGSMNDYCDNLLFCLYKINSDSLKHLNKTKLKKKFLTGITREADNKYEFDNIIRLPDYFAGAVSSWDMLNNLVDKEKHSDFIVNIIADNPKVVVLKIVLNEKEIYCNGVNIKIKK
jgi:hypothetical protein